MLSDDDSKDRADSLTLTQRLRGYSSPFGIGHKALQDFWEGTIYVTEKIDGSQFSFGLVAGGEGELVIRSRRVEINQLDPGMFKLGVETVQQLAYDGLLFDGWTYRGEFLSKPKHNTMAYDRVPAGNVIIFDIDTGDQNYITSYSELVRQAGLLDLEVVPALGVFEYKPEMVILSALLETESVLGGGKVEGIVMKNYDLFGRDKKVVMAKLVSQEFIEKHSRSWAGRNPGKKQFVATMIEGLATEARWMKAVQHLREAGTIEGEMQDIPEIMLEIQEDVEKEMRVEIMEAFYNHFWPQVKRGLTRGMPIWYKGLLQDEQMNAEDVMGVVIEENEGT